MSDFTAGVLGILVLAGLSASVFWWFGLDRVLWIVGSTLVVFVILGVVGSFSADSKRKDKRQTGL